MPFAELGIALPEDCKIVCSPKSRLRCTTLRVVIRLGLNTKTPLSELGSFVLGALMPLAELRAFRPEDSKTVCCPKSRFHCTTLRVLICQNAIKQKGPVVRLGLLGFIGSLAVYYSRMASATLPSSQLRFTSEFGMDSGGSTALLPPGKNCLASLT